MVGPKADLTYEYEHLGDSAKALTKLALSSTGFGAVLKEAKKPIVLVGQGALSRPDAAAVSAAARSGLNLFICIDVYLYIGHYLYQGGQEANRAGRTGRALAPRRCRGLGRRQVRANPIYMGLYRCIIWIW